MDTCTERPDATILEEQKCVAVPVEGDKLAVSGVLEAAPALLLQSGIADGKAQDFGWNLSVQSKSEQ
jgi:hypothetical protein